MHELGIVFHVMKAIERVGEEKGLSRVSSVTLELGEVSGVVAKELTDCWNWAVKKSPLLKEAVLVTETVPAVTLCERCGAAYPTVPWGRTCPSCGSGQTHLIRGNETNIKEIRAC